MQLCEPSVRTARAHTTGQTTLTGRGDQWAELATPLQSTKLAGGLHGDDWTLHWLAWQYSETADSSHVERTVEWALQCMYELIGGQEGDREAEEEVEELKHNGALIGHSVLATLTTGSFAAYVHLLLLLSQLQLTKLHSTSAISFVAAVHRALLVVLPPAASLPARRRHLDTSTAATCRVQATAILIHAARDETV